MGKKQKRDVGNVTMREKGRKIGRERTKEGSRKRRGRSQRQLLSEENVLILGHLRRGGKGEEEKRRVSDASRRKTRFPSRSKTSKRQRKKS